MRPVTVQETINAIVERSLPAVRAFRRRSSSDSWRGRPVPAEENLKNQGVRRVSVWAKGADGRRLRAGHVLTHDEAERVVRTLLG